MICYFLLGRKLYSAFSSASLKRMDRVSVKNSQSDDVADSRARNKDTELVLAKLFRLHSIKAAAEPTSVGKPDFIFRNSNLPFSWTVVSGMLSETRHQSEKQPRILASKNFSAINHATIW